MSQNLSFSSIAATLAVLSASGLVACASSATPPAESPADAKELPAATTNLAATGDQGPGKEGVLPTEGASGSTPSATSVVEEPKPSSDAAATAPTAPAATPAAAPAKDPKASAAPKKKQAGAKGGCGAGTCG
jgi:hypothetical protein